MRVLPENPNIDHVRQQARDLLIALRETDPAASLSQAQRALAEQYGFSTWTAVRHEVHRICSERSDADRGLIDGIAAAFDLGEVLGRGVVAAGVMGPAYRVGTTKGSWSVHGALSWVDEAQAEEAGRLMNAAREAAVLVPAPRRTSGGSLLATVHDRPWRVDEWMKEGPPVTTPLAMADAHRLGELLGRLHSLALRPTRPMNPWLTRRRSLHHWVAMTGRARDAGVEWADLLEAALPALERLTACALEEPDLGALVLSHTNLVASNISRGANHALIPRAWEFAGAIPTAWELGLVLHSWTSTPAAARASAMVGPFIDAYTAVAGRRPAVEPPMFAAAINAWLQWLASRVDYALDGDGDERTIAARELSHMLAAPLTPESFDEIVEAATSVNGTSRRPGGGGRQLR
ncbi:MAG: hypothetical protein ACREN2_12600 [Candidatus Dormibacteria bacterium]